MAERILAQWEPPSWRPAVWRIFSYVDVNILEIGPRTVGPVRNPVLKYRVRLFSLVPLFWESNPKLQSGWCKTQPQAHRGI
jgi:hypothetical protein